MAAVPNRRRRLVALTLALLAHAVVVLLAVAAAAVRSGGSPRTLVVGGLLTALAPFGFALTTRRGRPLRWLLVAAGLPGVTAMEAGTGGVASPVALLVVLVMVWFSLLATPTELVLGLLLMVGCTLGPMYVVGAPAYPVAVAQAALLVLVAAVLALTVSALARQAGRLRDRICRETHHDPLTGLANRRGWDEQAQRVLSGGVPVSVAVLDLDGLGRVNAARGYDEGDRVLRATGQRLTVAFPVHAVVARLGGGEFAVLLADADPDDVVRVLARVRVSTPSDAQFSAGVAVSSGAGASCGDLLRWAGVALHRAKVTGRSRTCVADAAVSAETATQPPSQLPTRAPTQRPADRASVPARSA